MSKINSGPSIYVYTDKNIFDVLQHKKISQEDLVSFLSSRGFLVSQSSSKQELSEKVSSLTMGYGDLDWIKKKLENPNRKEKMTHSKLKGDVDNDVVNSACRIIKANLTANGDDSVKVTKSGNETTLAVTYVEHDYTKTELRQRTIKTCEIQIVNSDDGLVMKMPSNKKAKEVSEQLKVVLNDQVEKKGSDELEELIISLESIASPEIRSRFFDHLVRNVPGFDFDTVTSVDVYHFDENEDDVFEDEESEEKKVRLASYINKAAFAGEGVLESKEFKQLHKQGFYIYKIIWTAIDQTPKGNKVEFQAQFGVPDVCTEFMYLVRGIYPYNERSQGYNISRRSASSVQNEIYISKLRDASEKALVVAREEYGE